MFPLPNSSSLLLFGTRVSPVRRAIRVVDKEERESLHWVKLCVGMDPLEKVVLLVSYLEGEKNKIECVTLTGTSIHVPLLKVSTSHTVFPSHILSPPSPKTYYSETGGTILQNRASDSTYVSFITLISHKVISKRKKKKRKEKKLHV